jgi:hypothetical protein
MSIFERNKGFEMNGLSMPKILSAAGHLVLIPAVTYWFAYRGGAASAAAYLGAGVQELSPAKTNLFFAIDIFYCARWALGSLTTLGAWQWWNPIPVVGIHAAIHCMLKYLLCTVVVAPTSIWSYAFPIGSPASASLTSLDYAAAAICILGGLLQNGSELQRYFFKRDPRNSGKVHTGGLFSVARFINHTGHVLHDLGNFMFGGCAIFLVVRNPKP